MPARAPISFPMFLPALIAFAICAGRNIGKEIGARAGIGPSSGLAQDHDRQVLYGP